MDVKLCIWTLLVVVGLSQVEAARRCIECTHISWTPLFNFEGAENIYRILRSKYNPACAQENPLDRDLFNYNQQLMSQQQQSLGVGLTNYDVGETICQGNSAVEKCHYIYGNASIDLPGYNAKMTLNIHVRNCERTDARIENRCYQRTSQHGNQESRYFIQNRLNFLSRELVVESFSGHECYCDRDLCYPFISSARSVVASYLSILLAAFVSFVMLS